VRQRLAQLGDSPLPGVEGLPCGERAGRGVADERRRRNIALADPERDQTLPSAAVIRDLDDTALGRAARLRAQRREQRGALVNGKIVHAELRGASSRPHTTNSTRASRQRRAGGSTTSRTEFRRSPDWSA